MAEGGDIADVAVLGAPPLDLGPEDYMDELHREVVAWLLAQLNEEESPGVKKYTDVCHYLSCMHSTPAAVEDFVRALKHLDACCCEALPMQQAEQDLLTVIPHPPAPGQLGRYRVRLWQLGFVEGASVKGA